MDEITILKDEAGKINVVTVNGKAIKPVQVRLLQSAQKAKYFRLARAGTAQNPFTGVTVDLNALEMTVYNFCSDWYSRYSYGSDTQVPLTIYDRMKYFLLDLNASAYMDLLD